MIINQAALSGIYRSFNSLFSQAYTAMTPQVMWPTVAMEVPSTSRETTYAWLGEFPSMREWLDERVVKDLAAADYTIKNKTFEATVAVDREDIEDDALGVYTPMIQGLAHAAATHPDQLIWALLKGGFATPCYDGQYFFDTDHPVGEASVSNSGGGSGDAWYLLDLSRPMKPLILQMRKRPEFVSLDTPDSPEAFLRKKYLYGVDDRKNVGFGLWQLAYGSKQTLDADSYAAARAAMMGFKNAEGQPLGIVPTHLIVPPSLEAAARKLVINERDEAGASNPWAGTAELVMVPWLA